MKRVLFVDDEKRVLEGIRVMLHNMRTHWDMHFAHDGEEALGILEDAPCDVIVSGMHMMGMHGADLLSHVKQEHPNTIRFAFAGNLDPETVRRAGRVAHQILAKPCEPVHLRSVISRALALHDHLATPKLKEMILSLGTLPSIPSLYAQISEELNSSDPSIACVAAIIEQDPGMTAKVLQFINSAYMGLRHQVQNITHAASLLGTENIRNLVLMGEIISVTEQQVRSLPFSMEAIWQNALTVGRYAGRITECEIADKVVVGQAYTAGLLHDLGLLILASNSANLLNEVFEKAADTGKSIFDVENELMGATHSDLGGYLLDLWGLPESVVEAITFQYLPSALEERAYGVDATCKFAPLTAVHVAKYFCEDASATGNEYGKMEIDGVHLDSIGMSDRVGQWWELCSDSA